MSSPNDSPWLPTEKHYAWGVCGFLLAAIGLIYAQTLWHPFVSFDDHAFVYDNPLVTAGLTSEGIKWAFTSGPFGEWYPLSSLSHMLDCQLFGLSAGGHHLTNVLLHAAASISLFFVCWRMTAELWPSAFVAAVFAVHPQHVESVAWVAERKDVLSGLFFMLMLGAWLDYVRRGRPLGQYLLAATLFALGLMSKPMLVTVPPLLLLLDFWPLARFGSARDTPHWTSSVERPGLLRLVLEKLPFLALAAADCWITLRTHAGGGQTLPWSERFGNAAVACLTYVVQCFYPLDLAVFYPVTPGGPPAWKVATAVVILGLISAAAVLYRRKCPYFFVGWFWYLGMLSPVLGVVKLGSLAMADRYMYLPGIGLYIALAWGAARLAANSPAGVWALRAAAGGVIAILTLLAVRQTSFWHDDETLWTHALACTTDNGKAEKGVADALAKQGRPNEAIPFYHLAQRHLTDATPYSNLGVMLAGMGRLDEASEQFRQAVAVEPSSRDAHINLAEALAQQSRFDEAREHFQRAIQLDPRAANAHYGIARLLIHDGNTAMARAELEQTVALDPRNAPAHADLGSILFQQGNVDEAIAQLEMAVAIQPRALQAQINLAGALASQGRVADAIAHYRQALAIDPNNPVARASLDQLLRDNAYLLKP